MNKARAALELHMVARFAAGTLAFLLAALYFHLGAQPVAVGLLQEPYDKLAHCAFYAVIAALLWTTADGRCPMAVLTVIALVSAADEWHQRSLPGRSADPLDVVADIVGAAAAVGLLQMLRRIRWRPLPYSTLGSIGR